MINQLHINYNIKKNTKYYILLVIVPVMNICNIHESKK